MKKFFLLLFTLFLPFGLFSFQNDLLDSYFNKKSYQAEVLQGGLSGALNYRVNNENKSYVLRILNPKENEEVRKQEIEAATFAGNLGIGPKIFATKDWDEMLMEYVEGKTLSPQLLQQPEKLKQVVQTIKKLHESDGNFGREKTIFSKLREQGEKLKGKSIAIPHDQITLALSKLQMIEEKFKNLPLVPCHNDLNSLNIIEGDKDFKLIDWTDARMGYALYDLGYFSLVNNINDESHLLSLYLNRPATIEEIQLLNYAKQVGMLRLFVTIYSTFEETVSDINEKENHYHALKTHFQSDLPPLSYFFDLHSQGKLTERKMVLLMALSAFHSFLNTQGEKHGI